MEDAGTAAALAVAAPPGPRCLAVEAGSADLWTIALPADPLDRRRCGHEAVLDILRRYLSGRRPAELRFARSPCGKPRLAGTALAFNVSHSGTTAVCAVATQEVGIDLEHIRPVAGPMDIARRFFSAAEVDVLRPLRGAARLHAFFRIWTRKEACAKAVGQGLLAPFEGFDVVGGEGIVSAGVVREVCVSGRCVFLRSLSCIEGWSGALANLGPDPIDAMRFWSYGLPDGAGPLAPPS